MVDLPTPDVIEAAPKTLVGVADSFDMSRRQEIPHLYEKFWTLQGDMQTVIGPTLYGVSMDSKPDGSFRYGVGVEIDDIDAPQPDGTCHMDLVGGTYVRFTQRTAMTEMPMYFDAIFSQWLPQSDWQMREGAVFEHYPDMDGAKDGVMTYEIWVPVAPK